MTNSATFEKKNKPKKFHPSTPERGLPILKTGTLYEVDHLDSISPVLLYQFVGLIKFSVRLMKRNPQKNRSI